MVFSKCLPIIPNLSYIVCNHIGQRPYITVQENAIISGWRWGPRFGFWHLSLYAMINQNSTPQTIWWTRSSHNRHTDDKGKQASTTDIFYTLWFLYPGPVCDNPINDIAVSMLSNVRSYLVDNPAAATSIVSIIQTIHQCHFTWPHTLWLSNHPSSCFTNIFKSFPFGSTLCRLSFWIRTHSASPLGMGGGHLLLQILIFHGPPDMHCKFLIWGSNKSGEDKGNPTSTYGALSSTKRGLLWWAFPPRCSGIDRGIWRKLNASLAWEWCSLSVGFCAAVAPKVTKARRWICNNNPHTGDGWHM